VLKAVLGKPMNRQDAKYAKIISHPSTICRSYPGETMAKTDLTGHRVAASSTGGVNRGFLRIFKGENLKYEQVVFWCYQNSDK